MPARRIKVFVVDDHPLVRDWLSNLLREQGDIEVCGQAEDARTGLAAIMADDVDIAVVDLSLKGGSGLELIKDLKEHCPATDVIVLSMHEEVGYAERALRAGARGYVTKRESTSQIVEAIRQVRAGRVFASATMLAALTERIVGQTGKAPAEQADRLSDRELDVFRRLGQGQRTREIATDLGLSLPTVQTYCARIKEKLGLSSGNALVIEAARWVQEHASQ